MGDMAEEFRKMREYKRERRRLHGIECPKCKELRPKANATILLPGQTCRVDGYRDERPRIKDK